MKLQQVILICLYFGLVTQYYWWKAFPFDIWGTDTHSLLLMQIHLKFRYLFTNSWDEQACIEKNVSHLKRTNCIATQHAMVVHNLRLKRFCKCFCSQLLLLLLLYHVIVLCYVLFFVFFSLSVYVCDRDNFLIASGVHSLRCGFFPFDANHAVTTGSTDFGTSHFVLFRFVYSLLLTLSLSLSTSSSSFLCFFFIFLIVFHDAYNWRVHSATTIAPINYKYQFMR